DPGSSETVIRANLPGAREKIPRGEIRRTARHVHCTSPVKNPASTRRASNEDTVHHSVRWALASRAGRHGLRNGDRGSRRRRHWRRGRRGYRLRRREGRADRRRCRRGRWRDLRHHEEALGGDDEEDVDRMGRRRSEEHTSELQSRGHLVCRLLLEKKKNKQNIIDDAECPDY